jgi:hypothetical protein
VTVLIERVDGSPSSEIPSILQTAPPGDAPVSTVPAAQCAASVWGGGALVAGAPARLHLRLQVLLI